MTGYADLKPGDLMFWSSDGTVGGIHHVSMYLGNDSMIHAPRTGKPVQIVDARAHVTSSPAGISCGLQFNDCEAAFRAGTVELLLGTSKTRVSASAGNSTIGRVTAAARRPPAR